MARESLVHSELVESANRLAQAVNNLNDLQAEFKNITSEIGESGSELGGDLGEFSKAVMEQEINAKLTRLSQYVEELKKQIDKVAATNAEESAKGQQLMDEIR